MEEQTAGSSAYTRSADMDPHIGVVRSHGNSPIGVVSSQGMLLIIEHTHGATEGALSLSVSNALCGRTMHAKLHVSELHTSAARGHEGM